MAEVNRTPNIQIKSLQQKRIGFLISYGILNLCFFFGINEVISNLQKSFSNMYVKDFSLDGSDFSILFNFLTMPIFAGYLIICTALTILFEFITIRIFRTIFLQSAVIEEERLILHRNLKLILLCSVPVNLICTLFYGNLNRIFFYLFFYWPLPLFTSILIVSKIRRSSSVSRGQTGIKPL